MKVDILGLREGDRFFAGCGNLVTMWCEARAFMRKSELTLIVAYVINGDWVATFDAATGYGIDILRNKGERIGTLEHVHIITTEGGPYGGYPAAIQWCQDQLAKEAYQ